ncbi:hypothetical protein BDZ45DRAFT_21970 [Acephala macrosclerotiorum]|nr:hypothetical protein BDZ45DRAFT_21970 [Acephala macrosclerotiorum]
MSIINDQPTLELWRSAERENEWATTRLWEYILRAQVFIGPTWAISSQQPPGNEEGNQRRVDIVIEHWDDTDGWMQWMFVEAKLAGATPEEVASAEQQAFTASVAYTHYYDVPRVCSMTCFGGKAKLWLYAGADYLEPFVPPESDGLGVREEYVDVHSTDGYQILVGLEFIRDHRVPAPTLQSTSSPSPPYNIADGESSSGVRAKEGMPPFMRHDQLY